MERKRKITAIFLILLILIPAKQLFPREFDFNGKNVILVKNPEKLNILDKYKNPISKKKLIFKHNSVFLAKGIVEINSLQKAVWVDYLNKDFYLLINENDKISNSNSKDEIQVLNGFSYLENQIQKKLVNEKLSKTIDGKIGIIKTNSEIKIIAQKGKENIVFDGEKFWLVKLENHDFVEKRSSKKWQLDKKIVVEIDKIIDEFNSKTAKIFRNLNEVNHKEEIPPKWEKLNRNKGIEYQFRNGKTSVYQKSIEKLKNSIDLLLFTEGWKVEIIDENLVISPKIN